ncbi:phage head morphogenesis protein, partial [Citrobacter freundii]
RTARAAGQWQRIERTQRAMPYLVYTVGPSREHRAEHLRWKDVCLPVDHPFWRTHMGPNGWGCKCGTRQISRYEYEQMKVNGTINTEAPEVRTVRWVNKRTGEEETIPEGIDPGWAYNPGISRSHELDEQLRRKQDAFDSHSPQR